jgi:YHS domain-containing protein/thiol-disulfide isomerase/thioredoxin
MRTPLFALSLSLSVAALFMAPAIASDPTPASVWKTDFAAAEAEAKSLNCPLLVHFHAKWCGPCRQMEKEVLHSAPVLKIIDSGFVAVKVDVDRNPDVSTQFKIKNLPTDMILSPEGKVLVKSHGYQDFAHGGDQDYRKYVANITRIDGQYAATGKRLRRPDALADDKNKQESAPAVANAASPTKTAPPATVTAAATADKLVPPPTEPKKVAVAASAPGSTRPAQTETKPDAPEPPTDAEKVPALLLAMEGYCPVTLRATRGWKPGSSDISLVHEGQTFYFAAVEKREEFKSNPRRYAPRLRGCDPVVLANADLAVRGSVKFGAYYEGELFLFETAESRATFRKDPAKYAKLQHALKPEDVQKIASAAGE